MNPKIVVAVILIVLGVAALAYQGISYTTREKAIDIGPIEVTTERTRNIPLPPIVGAVALIGGIVMLVMNKRTA